MSRGIVALVFRCEATRGSLSLNKEVQSFHWATPTEVSQMVTEAFAVRVLDALHEGAPAIRQHDGVHLV
ncbi:hypothetical protein Pmi06nite_39920 [Planotetraspora mira]|uniref:NUDIX hydrolase n=1 Tax=Planotetraspora mira TaxID=58121 RepID=A0A8J3TP43_9ACTN|nr:hypothetical protein Pmi06nite_39920 [Planotetraspora mira]